MSIHNDCEIPIANALLVVVLPLLLIGCGDDKALTDNAVHTVDYAEFHAFKTSMSEQMSSHQTALENRQRAFSATYQELSEHLIELDKQLSVLSDAHQKSSERLVILDANVKAMKGAQQSLATTVTRYTATKTAQKKKAKALRRFPFSLSSIAIWGDHYLIYMVSGEEYVPMRLNDMLGDWCLTDIDYAMKRVVFKHRKTKQSIVRKLP